MRQDLQGRLVAVTVAAVLGWVCLGAPAPASAGTVKVEGSAVVYKAGNNEANTLVINARGSALNPATGQLVSGFTLSDSTATIGGGPGCQVFTGTAVCDITNASFVSIDLGDKDDRVSQEEREPGDAVPMRVKGGLGKDTLIGGPRADLLDGGPGDDTIDGGDGNDTLEGGAGKDVINAQDNEKDSINCGLGRDTVTADAVDSRKRCN